MPIALSVRQLRHNHDKRSAATFEYRSERGRGRDLGKAAIGAVDEDLVEIPVAIDVRRADPLPFSRRALLKPDCPGGTGSGWQLLSQHIRLQFSSACGGDAMAGIRY
jgi:hypothetical protein